MNGCMTDDEWMDGWINECWLDRWMDKKINLRFRDG